MDLKGATAQFAKTVLCTDEMREAMGTIVTCFGNCEVMDFVDDAISDSNIPSLKTGKAITEFYNNNSEDILKTLKEAKNSKQPLFNFVSTNKESTAYDMLLQIRDAVMYGISKRIIDTAIVKGRTDGIEISRPLQKSGFGKTFQDGASFRITNQNGINFFFDTVKDIAKEAQETLQRKALKRSPINQAYAQER